MKNLKMSFWERQLETLLKHFWNFDFNISGKSNLSIWRNTSDDEHTIQSNQPQDGQRAARQL